MNTQFVLDFKAVVGVIAALLGYIVTNGAVILPTLPADYQHVAGAVIAISGIALTFFSSPPVLVAPAVKAVPVTVTAPVAPTTFVTQGPKGPLSAATGHPLAG